MKISNRYFDEKVICIYEFGTGALLYYGNPQKCILEGEVIGTWLEKGVLQICLRREQRMEKRAFIVRTVINLEKNYSEESYITKNRVYNSLWELNIDFDESKLFTPTEYAAIIDKKINESKLIYPHSKVYCNAYWVDVEDGNTSN